MTQNNKSFYYTVLHGMVDNQSLADGLIHPERVNLMYVSESWFDCIKMMIQKTPVYMGQYRPIKSKSVKIYKLPLASVEKLLMNCAENSSDHYYEEDFSSAYRRRYSEKLNNKLLATLAAEKKLDFRKPDAGVKLRIGEVYA